MINVDKTIYTSLIDKIQKLRYQAQDNPQDFKSILRLIILSDILEWSEGIDLLMDVPTWSKNPEFAQSLQEKLLQKQIDLILCNPVFKVQYSDTSTAYVNVNTAQNNSTWKRVWDSPNAIQVDESDIGICRDQLCIPSFYKLAQIEVKEFPFNR